jgi:RHS repeat-associated protein
MNNLNDWSYTLSGEPDLLAGRGFTEARSVSPCFGEHSEAKTDGRTNPDELCDIGKWLPWFNLYNMNGRLYDPVVGRFLSADNYVQAPGFTQSFNRYSYCLNNPLKYTDPDGEFFLGTIITFVSDLVKTAFFKGGLDPTSSNARQNAWRDFDPTAPWSKTNKAFKIDMGGFATDPNRTIVGQGIQLLSRWTWELPQTATGKLFSHTRNFFWGVDNVDYYGGATLVNKNDNSGWRWGLTLGPYINSKNVRADPYRDPLFRHEYGHTLQSRLVGPLYLTSVGLPSLVGAFLDYNVGINDHDREWYETQANRMAFRYLENHDPEALSRLPWPRDDNDYPREYSPNWYWIFASPSLPFMWWLFF